jgi:hypothetical protein
MTDPSDFEDISEWIDLDEILVDCCELGAEVMVYGKVNKFRGIIDCLDGCTKLKIKYDLAETGYPDGHTIETCDINSIRCKLCCDVTWYQVDSCADPDLDGLPSYPPDGQVYLYVGESTAPDCIFKYQGFGDFKDIGSYVKFPGNDIESFDLDGYDLTINMANGESYTVTLASNSVASICLDALPLDLEEFEEA